MKSLIIVICLFICNLNADAQSKFTKQNAKSIIDTFFEGFHEGDTLKMSQTMASNMVMQTAYSTKDGQHKVEDSNVTSFLTSIANRPTSQKWDEQLLDYNIQIDGNLAHVWTPYKFYFNGNFSHCGANAFTLTKTNEGWRILHLIDSRRFEGCLD
ncbi:hypothetical protein ULMS_16950 [Patiriisocius marinistellae]|uniref:SnoaL-like domain-containing protein n=1 Tax=Patiriisocius marinistellae TaxID=2494560 RepID=A0A5J4FU82_9FLAO|nr:nuclear transport factor 2 family protein [Patiriisocius marinistellae]GEQ86187.1 hypothetical protein ULMS_16950 [Patiriisocius marinistellae]